MSYTQKLKQTHSSSSTAWVGTSSQASASTIVKVEINFKDLLLLSIGFALDCSGGLGISSASFSVTRFLVQSLHLVPLSIVFTLASLAQVVLRLNQLSLSLCFPFIQSHFLGLFFDRSGRRRVLNVFLSALLNFIVGWWLVKVIDVLFVATPVMCSSSVTLVDRLYAGLVAARLTIALTLASIIEVPAVWIARLLLEVSISVHLSVASVVAFFTIFAGSGAACFVESRSWVGSFVI